MFGIDTDALNGEDIFIPHPNKNAISSSKYEIVCLSRTSKEMFSRAAQIESSPYLGVPYVQNNFEASDFAEVSKVEASRRNSRLKNFCLKVNFLFQKARSRLPANFRRGRCRHFRLFFTKKNFFEKSLKTFMIYH